MQDDDPRQRQLHESDIIITLHAICGAVYCNRSCLFVGACVCGAGGGGTVTTITRNCVYIDTHQTGFVGKGIVTISS